MKRFYTLLSLAILLPIFSFAQSNYKPGYVVNLKGDTSKGFIDYKEWENNPASISFKNSLSGSAQQFTTNDIKYFRINNSEAYARYSGSISTDPVNVGHLSTGRDTSTRTAVVFLKVEASGKYVTLYSYTDDLKKRYFVAEQGNQPGELIYRFYMNSEQGNLASVTETKYKGQLIYIASKYNGSDNIKARIENASYDQDLVGIVDKINGSSAQKTDHANAPIAFYAGISAGPTSVKPQPISAVSSLSPVNSYTPRILFGVNGYINPDVGKLVFRGEIALAFNTFKTILHQESSDKAYFSIKQLNISVNPQILYNVYNTDNFKFYLDAGVTLNYSKYSDNKFYNGTSFIDNSENNNIYSNAWLSIPFSAGMILNKNINVFVTYTLPTFISNNDDKYYSTQLGIAYIFGRSK